MRKFLLLNLLFIFSVFISHGCPVSISATSTSICFGGSVTLTASGGNNYFWNPGNFNSNSITVNPVTTTTYSVYATTGPCVDTAYITITVYNNFPTVTISAQNDTICEGVSNVLTANGANQYTWMPGNAIGNTYNPLPNATTTYTVTGVNSPGGCSSTSTKTMYIKPAPKPILNDILNTFNPFNNCGNTTGLPAFNVTVNTPLAASIVSYELNWGDGSPLVTGLIQSSFPLNHTYNSYGIFNLVFKATYTNGCERDTIIQVINQTNPSIGCTGPGNTLGCLPVQYLFIISGYQQNTTGTTYTWDFGDGTSPITWNSVITDSIYHTFNTTSCGQAQNQFIVSVSAQNACATTTATVNGIKIFSKGHANFTINDSISCVNTPVYFTNSSINGYNSPTCNTTTTYLWNFGDPNTTADTSNSYNPPPYTYTATGTYTVTLVSYSGCGNDTIQKLVCIEENNVDFTSGPISNCVLSTVQFTNTSVSTSCINTPYTWSVTKLSNTCVADSLNDYVFTSGTSTSISPAIRFNNQGQYRVRLEHTNSCGTAFKDTLFLIKRNPIITISAADTICENSIFSPTATIQNCAANTLTYLWNFPNATPSSSALSNPSVTFPPGVHTYSLTVTNECGSSTFIKTLTIIPEPTITLSSLSNNSICLGANDTLNAIGAISYIWQNPSIGSLSGSSIIVSPIVNSTYTVTGTSTFGCTATSTISITINPLPSFTLSITPPSCVPGNDAVITVNATGGLPAYSYKLNSLIQASPIFNSLSVGVYTISVIDANQCSFSATQNITTPNAPAFSNVTHTNILCNGDSNGSIQATASGGSGSLQYTLQPNNITNTNGSFPNLIAGIYTVIVTDNVGCSAITTVNVNQPAILSIASSTTPVSCFGQNNGEIFLNAIGGTSGFSYQIQSPLFTNSSGIFTTLVAGTYTATITDANNCSVSSIVNISQPNVLSWSSASSNNLLCNGSNTGEINVQVGGGVSSYTYTLSPGLVSNSSGSFIGLSAQTYTVTSVDANNCSLTTSITITEPTPLLISSITNTNPTCIPGNDGTLTVNANGGVGPYSYAISPTNVFGISNTFNNLSANTYTVIVKDANLCTVSSIYTITTPNSPQILNISVNDASCNPGNDGSLVITANGGLLPYQYSISTFPGIFNPSASFSGLSVGVYTLTVKDSNGCTGSSTASINTQSAPIINSVNLTNATCNPGCNGSALVNASSIFSLQYKIDNGAFQSNPQFLNLCANTYTITVKDTNNCTASTIININTNNTVQINVNSFNNITCYGLNNGQIQLSSIGGILPFTFSLQPGNISNTTGNFNSLAPNTYTITSTDVNGCSQSTIVNLSEPMPLTMSSPLLTHVNCFGGNDGIISLNGSGGTGQINFNIQPNNITNSTGYFNNLIVGSYTIVATDVNGCSISTITTINQPALLQISNISNTIPTCVPSNNSTLTILSIGGTFPYTYSIGGAFQSNNAFSNLGPATYTITVLDANNCSVTSTWSITLPNSPIFNTTSSNNVLCFGDSTGSISTQASGGTGLISYTINPGNITNQNGIFNSLYSNNYTIIATDILGCSSSTNIPISQPQELIFSNINTTPISCNGGSTGSVTTTMSGGNPNYSFTLMPNNNNNTIGTFTSLQAGSYTISVSDANACTTSTSVVISQPQPIVFNSPSIQNVLCFNDSTGSIVQTALGGSGLLTYLITPGNVSNTNGIFSNLSSGTYTILATDVNGCSVTTTVLISQPNQLIIDSIVSSASSCLPMNMTIFVSGGSTPYLYSLNGATPLASNNFIGLTSGTYTITVSDNNGCSISNTNTLVQPNAPVISSYNITTPSCFGLGNGSINSLVSIGGSAPYNYSISPGSNFNNLIAGSYTIIVTDANACTNSTLIVINQPSPITLNTLTTNNVTCYNQTDGTININYVGGTGTLTYTLQPLNIINTTGSYNSLASNTYTIMVSDAANCSSSTSLLISNPPQLLYTSVSTTPISCNGLNNGSIVALAGGGTGLLTYTIFPAILPPNSNGVFNSLAANNYTVTVNDVNNCSADTAFSFTQPPPVTGSFVVQSNVSCYNGNNGLVSVFANGGYAPFQYYLLGTPIVNSTGVFGNLTAGTYSVQIVDSAFCSTIISPIVVSQPTPMQWGSVYLPHIKCFGNTTDSLFVLANGGTGTINYSITPSGPQNNFTGNFYNLTAQTYTVTAQDANGCTLTSILTITQNPSIEFPVFNIEQPGCNGDSNGRVELYATGGTAPFLYQFNGSVPSTNSIFTGIKAGYYTIRVTDALNCTKDTSILLFDKDRLLADVLTVGPEICKEGKDGTIYIKGSGGVGILTYSLLPDSISNNNGIFNNLATGNYTIFIRDSVGCKYDSAVFITPTLNPLNINILKNDLGCLGVGTEGWAQANVTGGAQPYTYEWSSNPPQYVDRATDLRFGLYTVKVTDFKGCKIADTVYINPGECCEEVYIPNAFTPNGDGKNDVFRAITSAGIQLIHFEIYNRWGEKVWSTDDYTKGWDGSFKLGDKNAQGNNNFHYIFSYRCLTNNTVYVRKGDVTLLK
jgi:gliding motility-associated-like protein